MAIEQVLKDLGAATAYAYAVEKGYTGTEAEFAELMASYASVAQSAAASATAAAGSATSAASSASTASAAATTATTKASEASTSATNAAGSASSAASSATAASGSATSAAASATTASGKASEAATAATTATTAKTDAVAAKTAAETAQTAAETAQGKAETAQGAAEDAAESVSASAAQIATNTSDISDLKEDLSTLNTEGTVPTSEQMLSENVTVDSVPYHFRKTASDNADREELEIVGGSVAWNQLAPDEARSNTSNGIVYTRSEKGPYILNGTATAQTTFILTPTAFGIKTGDKVLITGGKSANVFLALTSASVWTGALNPMDVGGGAIGAAIVDGTTQLAMIVTNGTTCANVSVNPQIFNLTAMFGSTIADHIYSLEQATAGAGVTLFRSLFPKDYYAYDAGSMQSVSGLSEHRTVGFNQWDEEWEVGLLATATGEPVTGTGIRSKNFCRCVPNTVYYIKTGDAAAKYIFWYDADKNFISHNNSLSISTSPSNAAYFKIRRDNSNTYNHDICINLSDPSKNGQYEPYQKHSYALDDSLTLRGVPTLVDGKIKFDGDIYSPSGKVTRRYGIVDLGTLTWAKHGTYTQCFSANASALNMASPSLTGNKGICTAYNVIYGASVALNVIAASSDSLFVAPAVWSASTPYIVVNDDSYTDAATFKTAMSGVYMVYELATPTTESADPYVSLQICHPNGTEEFVSTGIVPVGHNTKYPDNMRAKLDGLPWNFASLIAPTESGYTATRNYTTGALLIVNNVLYKATANIANGGNITVGTNVTATTLAEVISALS